MNVHIDGVTLLVVIGPILVFAMIIMWRELDLLVTEIDRADWKQAKENFTSWGDDRPSYEKHSYKATGYTTDE